MERTITITDEAGMHARPASKFSKKAAEFDNDITIAYNGKEVNLKSVMGLMSLGIPQNGKVTLKVEGDDAEEVLDVLEKTLVELELTDEK